MMEDEDVMGVLRAASDLYHEQTVTVKNYRCLLEPAKSYADDLIRMAKDNGWWEHWSKWEWSVMRDELVRLGLEDLVDDDDDQRSEDEHNYYKGIEEVTRGR